MADFAELMHASAPRAERTCDSHITHMRGPLVQLHRKRSAVALADAFVLVNTRRHNQEHQTLASPSSVTLFTAWAAKHKEVLAIEDRWNFAVQHDPAAAGAIHLELESARGDAQRMLAQAQSRFNEEERARE